MNTTKLKLGWQMIIIRLYNSYNSKGYDDECNMGFFAYTAGVWWIESWEEMIGMGKARNCFFVFVYFFVS